MHLSSNFIILPIWLYFTHNFLHSYEETTNNVFMAYHDLHVIHNIIFKSNNTDTGNYLQLDDMET